jgi:hypothetical protein
MNTANEMTGTIAHTDVFQETDHALELEEHFRVNLAGMHIDDTTPHAKTFHIEMPTNLNPETITGICIKVAHVQHGILSDDELVAFLQFRDYPTLLATAAAASRMNKEMNQRFTSGSGSPIVNLFLAHRTPTADGLDRKADAHSSASHKAIIPKGQTEEIKSEIHKSPEVN